MSENNAYFKNYLALLNLRLYSLLPICPSENREEARSRMAVAADPTLDPYSVLRSDETMACENLLEGYNKEHESLIAAAENSDDWPRLEIIRSTFDLDNNEMVLLTAVLAAAVSDHFRNIYSLYAGSEYPRMSLLLSLLDEDVVGRFQYADLLGNSGKLLSYHLIEPVGTVVTPDTMTAFRPAPGLLLWLNEVLSTDIFVGRGEWRYYPEVDWADCDYIGMAAAIETAMNDKQQIPMVSFYGPDEDLLIKSAEKLAGQLERPLLLLNLKGLSGTDAYTLSCLALRDCMLNQGILVLYGLADFIDSGSVFSTEAGQLFEKWNVPIVFLTAGNFVFSPYEVKNTRLLLRASVPGLTGAQRFTVWKKNLSGMNLPPEITDEALETLGGQFTLNSAQIRAAVNAGVGKALTEDRELTMNDLYEGARVSSMHHLSDLAKKMENRYTLADLVLPEKQTQEIAELIAMARNRSKVLEEWGVGKKLVSGRGISALFTGVPGTGKTLSAQAIAGELGLDIYRVDLSTIISKYVGETEKNLERIFNEAQSSNVILFFDEADSLFGRRSEVSDSHDRYANIEVGYLLQRIETYDGIVLMATNLGANLDEAFARRIQFIIDFPFPDEETRLRLWQLLLPDNIEKEEEIDLAPFASAFKIAGGGIRNAVVWAIYESARNKRPLTRDDLIRGVEREYQKMGKVIPNIW